MTRQAPRFSFHLFFISVGSPTPTSKIQHRLKILAFKICPNCKVGPGIRPQKGQRDNFTRELPCLQQSILGLPVRMKPSLTSVSRRPDTRGSYVTFMHVESTARSIPCKKKKKKKTAIHLIFFGRLGRHRRA